MQNWLSCYYEVNEYAFIGVFCMSVTHLYSIVTEEKSSIRPHAHLKAGRTTPNWRFPNQQGE